MNKEYKACQSCGAPFDKLPEGQSVSDNYMYCTLCHKDGEFTYPNLKLEEMEKVVYDQVKKHTKFPDFLIKMHVKSLKKLERWKK